MPRELPEKVKGMWKADPMSPDVRKAMVDPEIYLVDCARYVQYTELLDKHIMLCCKLDKSRYLYLQRPKKWFKDKLEPSSSSRPLKGFANSLWSLMAHTAGREASLQLEFIFLEASKLGLGSASGIAHRIALAVPASYAAWYRQQPDQDDLPSVMSKTEAAIVRATAGEEEERIVCFKPEQLQQFTRSHFRQLSQLPIGKRPWAPASLHGTLAPSGPQPAPKPERVR